jgi:NAD(P)-dependent dehydrogenase (short-subunit alcohol dehydrogenase family)
MSFNLAKQRTVAAPPSPLAIVTGGRRGIGAAIAIALARQGFDVAVTDIDVAGAEQTVKKIRKIGRRGLFVQSDLAEVADHARVVATVTEWGGPVACLVNNAGVPAPTRGDLLELSAEAFDSVLDTNLRGTLFFTQAVARSMLQLPAAHLRSIITISSVSAEMASPERSEYCLSKAALAMAVKLFALRLAADNIAVFELRPGVIRTPMTEAVAEKYQARITAGLVPMGRWGEPEDVANAAAALASGQFAFATGSVINVDGGLAVRKL